MVETLKSPDRRRGRLVAAGIILAVIAMFIFFRGGSGGGGDGGDRPGTVTLLAVNDIYRIAGVYDGEKGGLARVRSLRQELEARTGGPVLLLHAGDALSPSLLSRLYKGAQMIDVLNLMDGGPAFDKYMYATLGNHEFDGGADTLNARLAQSGFTWLGANVVFAPADGSPSVKSRNLKARDIVRVNGVAVGLFGLTIDIAHPGYIDHFVKPLEAARSQTAALRAEGADIVIGLTHLAAGTDEEILATLCADGPDLIVGGHEHSQMAILVACEDQDADQGRRRYVAKADSDAVSASVITLTLGPGPGPKHGAPEVSVEVRGLGADTMAEDPAVGQKVEEWLVRHDHDFCTDPKRHLIDGCLDDVIGKTSVVLYAEETEIRGTETNLGDWIADRMIEAHAGSAACAGKATVSFINSGALRLNQDVPPGLIRRRQLEELFAYPSPLKLLKITGATLRAVVAHGVSEPGAGKWLQVGGMAFRYDDNGETTDLTLLGGGNPRPAGDDQEICAVTVDYLINPKIGDQDGFTMLNGGQVVDRSPSPELKEVVKDWLDGNEINTANADPGGDGRICLVGASGAANCRAL